MNKYSQYKLTDNYQKVSVTISLVLFFMSLTFPAFYIDNSDASEFLSMYVFAFGWSGFLAGNFFTSFIWLANPLAILTIILTGFNKKAAAVATGAFALLLAVSFLAVDGIATSESGSGPFYKVNAAAGYWLWLASVAVLFGGIVLSYLNTRKTGKLK